LSFYGCDQAVPTLAPGADSYYPLVHGARWTYVRTSVDMTLRTRVKTMSRTTHAGREAFDLDDGDNVDTLVRDASQTLRVQEIELDDDEVSLLTVYDPGFLRVDDSWDGVGAAATHSHERRRFDGAGNLLDVDLRGYTYTVEAVDDELEVAAGGFVCLRVRRERVDTGERRRFWVAWGVGQVRQDDLEAATIDELVEYYIPPMGAPP
jgi:hypothetical protein